MRRVLTLLVALLFATFAFTSIHLSRAQDDAWTPLFDGESLDGWAHVGDGEMVLEEGLLKTKGGMGLLWYTERKFEDAVLRVEYKPIDESNAGVFIRIPERPTEPWMPVNRGYEVQINPIGDAYHRTGVLYSLTEAKANVGQSDEWNVMEITLDGKRTVVHVNDTLVTDYTEGDPVPPKEESYEPDRGPRPEAGYIGLQNHGEGDVVHYRSVKVRPLKEEE